MTPCAAATRRRHRRLADYCQTHLPHTVGHVDFIQEPTPQTELVLPDATAVPPAVLTAIAVAGLEIVPDASGTQGTALVVVCR